MFPIDPRATDPEVHLDPLASLTPTETPHTETERAELIRLRAEAKNDKSTIAELRMQVEFAKKVAAYFAKESR